MLPPARCQSKADQARRGGCARAALEPEPFLEEPRIHRLSAEPNIVERESAELASGARPRRWGAHDRASSGNAIAESSAPSGRIRRCPEDPCRPRNAMDGPGTARGDFFVAFFACASARSR